MNKKIQNQAARPMGRWFRFYDECLDDPKAQRLDPVLFKTWVNLLCLASRNDGVLPCLEDVAFALREQPKVMASRFEDLLQRGLLDVGDDGTYTPHNWSSRQYKSDNSTERSQKSRSAKSATLLQQPAEHDATLLQRSMENDATEMQRCKTAAATPPETETETDSDTEADIDVSLLAREGVSKPPKPPDQLQVLETKLREAAGWEREPHPNLLVMGPVAAVISMGVDLDLDLLPAAKAHGPKLSSRTSWKYILSAAIANRDKRLSALAAASNPIPDRMMQNDSRPKKPTRAEEARVAANIVRAKLGIPLEPVGHDVDDDPIRGFG